MHAHRAAVGCLDLLLELADLVADRAIVDHHATAGVHVGFLEIRPELCLERAERGETPLVHVLRSCAAGGFKGRLDLFDGETGLGGDDADVLALNSAEENVCSE